MSKELIIQDFSGYHNTNMDETRARLIKGGSWKKQRIIVIIPAGDMIPAKCALSMWNLAFPPNNGVVRILAQGMEVGEAYSNAIEGILADPNLREWEYILTVEHDNVFNSNACMQLVEAMENNPQFACIGGSYFTKGPQGCWQGWGAPEDEVLNFRPQIPKGTEGLQEVCGTGMGFNLWRLSMFRDEKLRRPFFKTLNGVDGSCMTQDLYFWSDARKFGYRAAINLECKVGHLDYDGSFGPKDMVW